MNFDDILQTWHSPHNRPDKGELERHKMHMIADLRKRRRSSLGLLFITLVPLLFLTAKLAMHLAWPDPALDRVDLSREWGVVPMFLLPWIAWLVLARMQRAHHVKHAAYDASIQASVAALLDENRTERLRYRIVFGAMIASVPLLAVVVFQLQAVGKVGHEVMLPAFIIYPVYVALVLAGCTYSYRKKMLPRKRELEALMEQYGEDVSPSRH